MANLQANGLGMDAFDGQHISSFDMITTSATRTLYELRLTKPAHVRRCEKLAATRAEPPGCVHTHINCPTCHWPVMLLFHVIMLVSNYAKWIHGFGARLCYLYASIIVYATLTFKK